MIDKGAYFDTDGNPLIRRSLCAFLDVLGFSDAIRTAFKNGHEAELFNRFYATHFKQIKSMTSSDGLPKWWGVKVFTDCIVLGFPFFTTDGESEFGDIIFTVAQYQYAMAVEGFFVRGGIALGPLFMDDNTAFGLPMLDAYNLEHNEARDPRIIFSEDVRNLVSRHLNFYGEPFDSPQNRSVSEDADGKLFVNYLDEAYLGDGQLDLEGLKKHKGHIETNLSRFANNPRVWAKYFWLANYHDWFIGMYDRLPQYTPDLKIDPNLAKTHPELLVKERKPVLQEA